MSLKVSVEGQVFELSPEMVNAIPYISNARAIEKDTSGNPIEITSLTKQTFLTIKKITEIANYNFPDLPKVKTNNLKEVIGAPLAEFLMDRNFKEINTLYKGAKFLQMEKLNKVLAAVVATFVYYKPTVSDYKNKKEQLKIQRNLNAQTTKLFKDKYQFMNN